MPKTANRQEKPKQSPNQPSDKPAKINQAQLEEQMELLRPALQSHGGDIELIRTEGERVIVRLTGACAGCPMAQLTLKQGVEKFLVKRVPGVAVVEAVPDSAGE